LAALVWTAIASWPIGEIGRAMSHLERAHERLAGITHVGTLAFGRHHSAMFSPMRHDHIGGAQSASELARLAHEHDLRMFRAFAVFLQGSATAERAHDGGLLEMRRGAELLRERNILQCDGLLKIELAMAEAESGCLLWAIAILGEAIETCETMGYRAFEAGLRRGRGEMLRRRDSADPASAEQAYRSAISIAREQGAHSYELLASLSLAKLYRSTGCHAEAHAALAPALEGFSPALEMLQIAEAEALLAALAETEEVKAAEAQRQRRLHLQAVYGQAMMWAKGFTAEETKAAFSHATELSAKVDNFSDRFAMAHGQWRRSQASSGVGEKPSSAGASTACASAGRSVD
jgi:hypothetical protein